MNDACDASSGCVEYWLPRFPEIGTSATFLGDHVTMGVATNGVEFTTDPLVNMFDSCGAHVYLKTRAYHYHLSPLCIMEKMGLVTPLNVIEVAAANASTRYWPQMGEPGPLIGYALDGFGIYAPYDESGMLLTTNDLDECNGLMVGNEYRYYVSPDAPYVPQCLKGTVIGTTEFSTPDPLKACPKRGRNVTYVAADEVPAMIEGLSCALTTSVTGYLACLHEDVHGKTTNLQTVEELRLCGAGYGVLESLSDSSYVLKYTLDATGNKNAMMMLNSTTKTAELMVTVEGMANGNVLESAEILIVGEPISFTGYLVDLFCWNQPGHVGIDGTPLETNPGRHANWCMRDVQVCRDNGFGVLEELEDGTYALKYSFDTAGNTNALAFVDRIVKFDDIVVVATGVPSAGGILMNATMDLLGGDVAGDVAPPTLTPTMTSDSCMFESDDPDYDYMTNLDANIKIHWTIETEGDEDDAFYPALRAQVTKSSDGWVGLGFSTDEFMASSDAVISTDGHSPQKYFLEDTTPVLSGAQTLAGTSTEVIDGTLVMTFTKKLAEGGEVEIGASGTDWGYVLYAYGHGSFMYHASRGAVRLDFTPVCEPHATTAPTVDPDFAGGSSEGGDASSCNSDDPGYAFALALDSSLVFYWNIVETGDQMASFYPALEGRLLKRGGGYSSLAVSEDSFMAGSEAIVGEDGKIPAKYELTSRTVSGVSRRRQSSQTLVDASCESKMIDGESYLDCRFTKQMAESGEIEIVTVGTNTFLWAHGSGSLSYHSGNRGVIELDLSSCEANVKSIKPVSSSAIKAHGALMIVAWAWFAPIGVIFSRLKTVALRAGYMKTWLYAHLFVQVVALVFTAAGFVMAYKAIKDADGVDHMTYRHPKLGMGVIYAGATQLLMGLLRPHAPSRDEPKLVRRWIFEILHRVVGYGALVLAVIAMLSGINKAMELDHISAVRPWNIAVIMPVVLTAFVLIATTIYVYITAEPPNTTRVAFADYEKANAYKGGEQKGELDTATVLHAKGSDVTPAM
ncbi:hypothetical protein CTAYLR_002209 [Chrysophaeum taylorii]|uniref:Cytochrome b561 domain-containing protein n=1 Tax=Chrysophaeum taylorii TaxID=2483200 RepID=A0AAD7UNR4_9STRA|nr:hypothetical protein CTAYLR_002209 [Chrysophaeum taylorii]